VDETEWVSCRFGGVKRGLIHKPRKVRRCCKECGLYRSRRLYGEVTNVTTEGKEVQKVLRSMPGRERDTTS